MASISNQQLIAALKNGEEDILFYLSKKYYPSARRLLRRNGFPDKETPEIFSDFLISLYREIQLSNNSVHSDFEQLFFNSLNDFISNNKPTPKMNSSSSGEKEIIASCFSILDETSKKLLSARYVEKLSFEQIAVRFNYSNPVIAQFEFDKAFIQYDNISKARMNVISE